MAMMECRECGHKISETAVSCPNCGATDAVTTKKRKTSLFTWLVVVLVALWFYFEANMPSTGSSQYVAKPKTVDTLRSKNSVKTTEIKRQGAVLTPALKQQVITVIEANELVSKAAFGHDEVGMDAGYKIFWIWMPALQGKNYDAIANHFCIVFTARDLGGIVVSIKKNGTLETLGRAGCR